MGSTIIDPDSSLEVLLEHGSTTGTRVGAHPLTAFLEPDYDAFQKQWFEVKIKEIQRRVGILKAAALVVAIDDELDLLVDAVSSARQIVAGKDRDAALYKLLFGTKRVSDLKKPVLGGQLAAMRDWVGHLKGSPHPVLQELGAKVEQAVKKADSAVQALADAKNENRAFRTTGERRALFDAFNAMQKLNYGKIAELPHTHPEANLPNTFAEQFFKKARARTEDEGDELSSAELQPLLAEAEARVEELKDRLEQTIAKETAAAEAAKTRAAKEAKLAEARALAKKAMEDVAAAEKALEDAS